MGFPLRLLAREVYDRVSVRVGEGQVALVTGEEKRVPARPKYWIATVEAMPLDREVDFVAVDEIQLAAHRDRGHVFTDRLLHARGRLETWFLGSDTIREALVTLVPDVEIRSSPRLSTLSWAGAAPLAQVPKRSAVVTFSLPRVYAIAEALCGLRGGAAVVVGALSPRARNAQVAMFQAGEVDHLVATDAIGMGLNLDIDHVAFAALEKFDGREARPLELAEVAQIAGRAGRHTRNGTFGIVSELDAVLRPRRGVGRSKPIVIKPDSVTSVERHRFPSLSSLRWRSADLDLSTVEALLASLEAPSPHPLLRRTDDAEDHKALRALAARDDIVRLSRARGGTALLRQVASVPDYQKLLFEDHVDTLADIYRRLMARDGALEASFVEAKLDVIARPSSDIHDLVAKLAATRLWSYVAQQGWVVDTAAMRDRTADVEDALSDALHRALRDRFVTRAKKRSRVGPVPTGPFAALRDRLAPMHDPPRSVPERIASARHEELSIGNDASIRFERVLVARMVPGRDLVTPDVRLVTDASPSERLRAERRLVAFARDVVRDITPDLTARGDRLSPAAKGLAYALSLGLSTAWTADVAEQVACLTDEDALLFRSAGYVFGELVVYRAKALKPSAVDKRMAFVRALRGDTAPLPTGQEVSVPVHRSVDPGAYLALGYPVVGGRAVRADVLERTIARTRTQPDGAATNLPVATWLGMPPRDAVRVLKEVDERLSARPVRTTCAP